MKLGLFAGSFNPWHKGHQDILDKALEVFDKVIIAQMRNPEKRHLRTPEPNPIIRACGGVEEIERQFKRVEVITTATPTLKVVVEETKPTAIIRGLRDGKDFDYELAQQYWNEDVGIDIPFVYFASDRRLRHVSSSAIRMVEGLGLKHEYTTF